MKERIVSNGRLSEKTAEFNALYKQMVDSYMKLPSHLGTEAIPFNPKEITGERLADYVKKMQQGLPEEGKKAWQQLYSDAMMQIKFIRTFFESFPCAEFEVKENPMSRHNSFICTNKKEAIEKAAEIEVPEDCKAYFEKVRAMYCSIVELREYEKANNLPGRSIEEMINYANDTDKFAGLYVDGYFQKEQYPI